MASVKQMRPGGPFYMCYKIPTGHFDKAGRPLFKRVQAPSGLYDRNKALMLAMSYEEVADAAAARRFTEGMARNFLERIAVLTNVGVAQTETLKQRLEKWLSSRQPLVAEKTMLNYASVVRDFLAFAAQKHVVSLADVTNSFVAEFRDHEVAAGKKGATVNKALSILGQAFEPAVVDQVFRVNPARGLRVKGVRNRAQTRRAFTFAEFKTLVRITGKASSAEGRSLSPDWQTLIVLCGYTGGRQQEVAQLTWDRVDFTHNRITLRRTKTTDLHTMPMHPAVRTHLLARKTASERNAAFVMPALAKVPGRTLSKWFREQVLPLVGIHQPYCSRDKAAVVPQVGRKLAAYSLHSLRHSLSSWLNAEGVAELTRMRIVGHEDLDVSRGYTHEDLAQMETALQKIPSVDAA